MYQAQDEQMGPRRKALVGALGGTPPPINTAQPVGSPAPLADAASGEASLKAALGGLGPVSQSYVSSGDAASSVASALANLGPTQKGLQLGKFAGKLEGFDTGKLNDASYTSPKYAIGRALSNFDPRQGVTDEVLAALNNSGAGQQYKRLSADKVVGQDGRVIDLVRGLNDPNGTGGWQLGLEDAPAGGGAVNFGGSTIPALLQGDAQGGIGQALQNIGALGQSGLLQELIARLRGGGNAPGVA